MTKTAAGKRALSAKRCPQCGKAARLDALVCHSCGHRYRTRFAAPMLEQTHAFDILLVPPARPGPPRVSAALRAFGRAFAGSFGLAALAGGLLWLARDLPLPAPRTALARAALASAAPADRAERVYGAVGLSMSLYELTEAAGGLGRVVRSGDPHLLLLLYDDPPQSVPAQSVQVSLTRTDISGDNYRVQSVALYRGRTLVQRRVTAPSDSAE